MSPDKRVDVLLHVCQKPLQTFLTLLSLMRHSGRHIDRIHFGIENVAAYGVDPVDYGFMFDVLQADQFDIHTAAEFIGLRAADPTRFQDEAYRHSIRYQRGWELSDKDFVFITHNDCLYKGDIIGKLISEVGDCLAAGEVGVCKTCPAKHAGRCGPEGYLNYRPSLKELENIYALPGLRKRPYNEPRFDRELRLQPWPLPECRVNEWAMLVNLRKARKVTVPYGPAFPVGAFRKMGAHILDTGAAWFRDISQMGFECRHVDGLRLLFEHRFGHQDMQDQGLYDAAEERARELLREEYGVEVG